MKTLAQRPMLRFAHKSIVYTLVFFMVNMPVWALNWNSGTNASFNGSDTVTVNALRSIGIWNDFDTSPGQLIQFLQNGGGALTSNHAVLNKVIGANPTLFEGILQGGQGHIILFNPNGITIGGTAVINAGRFSASTMELMMTDQEFLAGNSNFEFAKNASNPSAQLALLAGSQITANRVDLLAQQINNAGTINTGTGGVVAMAAGERVLLGEPGSKVIVEMSGIDGGSVLNAGTINAPEGTIVMAAGDIYSVPIHPQLEAEVVRVETGSGTVTQEGTIDAGTGNVVLTAGDTVTLADGSSTSAIDGEVLTYAYDFEDTAATTYFNQGAEISVGTGLAGINGNHISFGGSVNASPESTIQVDPVTLTIANGDVPDGGPALDTVYEVMVENYSQLGINLDLAADDLISVELMDDGQILGGSGDIQLRNVFDNGGIIFEEVDGDRTSIRTVANQAIGDGGNIFMAAGAGGIVAGELSTDTLSNDKTSNPGRIILLTTNEGDMDLRSMVTERGNISEISAISSGNLMLNGEAISTNQTVAKDDKNIGFARICLVALKDITIDAERGSISVEAHGKFAAVADIIICAGEDITITNIREINAYAQTSENTQPVQLASARVDISAGGNQPGPAVVSIDGTIYNPSPAADNSGLPVSARTNVSGAAPIGIDTGDTAVAGDPGQLTWQEIDADPDELDYIQNVRLTITNNGQVPPSEPGSPCEECPTPPGLPPVPRVFFIMDDSATLSWSDIDFPLDVLANDDKGGPLDGYVSMYTDAGGTLKEVTDGTGITAFEYTPPPDAVYVWDGVSDFAAYTDTFTYKAVDKDGNESINTATVTLTVTNFLPTLSPDSDTIHMSTPDNPTSSDFDLTTLVVDPDGTPGTLNYGIVEGLIPVSNGDIPTDSGLIPDTLTISNETVTYAPLDGYVSPGGEATTFGYTVSDSSIVNEQAQPVVQSESLDVTVTNTLPGGDVSLGDAPMNAVGEVLGVTGGDFTDAEDPFAIVSIDPATDDFNKNFGGSLSYNGDDDPYVSGDDYTYSADGAIPGYVGQDNFDVQLWDGQRTYFVDGTSEEVYGAGTIDLTIVNDRPEGDSWLGTTPMDTALTDDTLDIDNFTDINGDPILDIVIDSTSSDDINKDFGGLLTYDGTTYDYDPTEMGLPGYVGDDNDDFATYPDSISENADDRFNVKLWDGEYDYTFDDQGGFERTKQFGDGTISVDITNELPEGDAWFGQVHMDSQGVTQDLEVDFAPSIIIEPDTYTGSVIGSDLYGGTLEYDGTTWTYSTDPTLPGYIGDDNDDFGQGGYVADDLFNLNLTNGQYDYWFSQAPPPDGYEPFEYADGQFIFRKAVFSDGSGTVSVDITNLLPTIDENTTIEHMNEDIMNQLFASDQLDPNPIQELDMLSSLDGSGNPTVTYTTDFGIDVTITQNPDGSLAYTYDPADGYVDQDSFDVGVWDGQINYVFTNDGEIDTQASTKEVVTGTVSLEYTNILPGGTGDLGSTPSGTPLMAPQTDVTSPVLVIDIPDLPQQSVDDVLSIPAGSYTGNAGGSLVFDGSEWTYTPAPGFVGEETFTINVSDGQNEYGSHIEEGIIGPVYGEGIVTVTVTELPPPPPAPAPTSVQVPVAPVAPLADYEVPKLVGCPAEMDAAAAELAINSDQLQLLIENAMATNPNLQPCDACQNLLAAASRLQEIDTEQLAAMNQIFTAMAPIDAPFTLEVSASVMTALAEFRNVDESQLARMSDEEYEQFQQFAMTDSIVEAFVGYISVLENDLRIPIGDSMALVIDKYFEPIESAGNPAITSFLISQMASVRTMTP